MLTNRGWLARQPKRFQLEVLSRGIPVAFRRGDAICRMGDAPGGLYGLVAGSVAIHSAPAGAPPTLLHLAAPGHWAGVGAYFTGAPRRVELRAATDCAVLALSLEQIVQITAADTEADRRIGELAVSDTDLAVRVVHELLIPDRDRRIAAVLVRCTEAGALVPLTQEELAAMAAATRKQVNAAMARFAAAGWVVPGYRAIRVIDPCGLDAFARQVERADGEVRRRG